MSDEDEGPFSESDIDAAIEDSESGPVPDEAPPVIDDFETDTNEYDFDSAESDLRGDPISEELLEAGASKELVDDLRSLMDEKASTGVPPPPEELFAEPTVDPAIIEQVEVEPETAERLLKIIYTRLNEFQTQHGGLPEQLVLGLPQFKAVEAYTWASEKQSAEERLPVDEVLVVPGPQIHCVVDPYAMIEKSLQEEADENE